MNAIKRTRRVFYNRQESRARARAFLQLQVPRKTSPAQPHGCLSRALDLYLAALTEHAKYHTVYQGLVYDALIDVDEAGGL